MFHWYMIVLIIGKTLKKIKKSFKKKYKSFYFLYSEVTITSVSNYTRYSFDIFRMYHACCLVD